MNTRSFDDDIPVSQALDKAEELDCEIKEEMRKYLDNSMHGYDRLKSLIFEQERWIKTAADSIEN